ncbi:50S ribosomal protein L18e [Candidatus Woesearchaeota archaeon]|nr:50S ribosomal protein L18e [Candidatus Woesearchaeota archaeon]
MVKRTGPTNVQTIALVQLLRKHASEQNINLWRRIADDLEMSTRQRREVNLFRLDKHTKENEMVIVPGKVLGGGDLRHKVTVAAFNFSQSAVEKIKKANGSCLTIPEMLQKNPKGQNVRIIG